MLFVGVGGSGGNTVRAIRQILTERLEALKWEGDFPQCWQTLWIDTITIQARGGFPSPLLPLDSYLGLLPSGLSHQNIQDQIINSTPASRRNEVLAGWLQRPWHIPITRHYHGRAIGRTVGVSQFGAMNRFLTDAHNRLTSVQAHKDLDRLNQLFDLPVSAQFPCTSVFVISSMAGTSGSGLFQDVAQLIKSINPALDDFMHVMLYCADVFSLSIPENMLKSVPGNTLGALSEVVNGVWREKMTSASSFFFDEVGRPPIGQRYGGRHHWLIGAKNNDCVLGATTKEIYYAVGSSLASLTTSPAIQQWLDEYLVVRTFPYSATMTDKTRLKVANNLFHYQPFAAMGFSRISMGLDRFVKYGAECITRKAVGNLLWPDFEPVSKDQSMNRNVQIETRADQLWTGFLDDSGLRERNPDNAVLDALKGQDSFYANFANECIANAAGRDSSLDPSTWEQRIMNYFNANRVKLLTAEKPSVFESVQNWTQEIQKRVLAATAGVVVSGGLYVTVELLKKLRKEVEFLIKTELPSDAEQKKNLTDEIRGRVLQFLSSGKAKIERSDQEIQKVQDTVKKGISFLGEVDRIMIAIELLADLDENFLAPLLEAMSNEIENFRSERANDDAYNFSSFSSFPTSDKASVQERFAPPNTEQTLIDYKEFPKLLREWSQAALEPEHQSAWEIRMTERALLGIPFDKTGDGSDQKLIETRLSWQPKNSNYRASIGNAQRASFSIYANIVDIYERAKSMINLHAGSLSNQVNMGIRPYLENLADSSEKSKRQKDFEVKFNSALSYSKPMVEENIKVLNAVHPGAPAGNFFFLSEVPLDNLEIQSRIVSIFTSHTMDRSSLEFNHSDSTREITIFSTTKGGRNPVVFDSLMKPIHRDWLSSSLYTDSVKSFWEYKRTKPAPESIPVAEEVLKNMFLGWFALSLTDLRKVVDTDPNKGRKVSVYSYNEKSWVDFPHPLLGLGDAPPGSFDTFPAVLNSLSIALLEVNATESITPLFAYHALMDAGTDIDDDQEYGVNRVLSDYVQGIGPVITDPSLTMEQRKASLIEDIEGGISSLKDRFADSDKSANPFEIDDWYEWRHFFLESLETLLDCVHNTNRPDKKMRG
jgi:hypothetical protein